MYFACYTIYVAAKRRHFAAETDIDGAKTYLKFLAPFLCDKAREYADAAETRIQLKMLLAVHFIKCGVFRICLVDCGNYGIARTFDS